MKLNKPFHPLMFQATLAAGGVALMPFNFLQFAIPHGKGLITLSHITETTFTGLQAALYYPLIAVMLVFVALHFGLTAVLLKTLAAWLSEKGKFKAFMDDPYNNVGMFAIISSLSMTANVFWAPLGFFFPSISNNLQSFMLPSLIFFGVLWLSVLILELRVMKVWFTNEIEITRYNFIWLLDVFAFALVNLTGTGIAAMSADTQIASMAAFASIVTLTVGVFLFALKLIYLIFLQIKKHALPDKPILPAFFLVIPITCLFGLSFYRIGTYLQANLSMELQGFSFFILNFSYVITIAWGIFCIYLLSDYLKNHFADSSFSYPQWGMV